MADYLDNTLTDDAICWNCGQEIGKRGPGSTTECSHCHENQQNWLCRRCEWENEPEDWPVCTTCGEDNDPDEAGTTDVDDSRQQARPSSQPAEAGGFRAGGVL